MEIFNALDEIKHKLTDKEYLDIMNYASEALKVKKNDEAGLGFYSLRIDKFARGDVYSRVLSVSDKISTTFKYLKFHRAMHMNQLKLMRYSRIDYTIERILPDMDEFIHPEEPDVDVSDNGNDMGLDRDYFNGIENPQNSTVLYTYTLYPGDGEVQFSGGIVIYPDEFDN